MGRRTILPKHQVLEAQDTTTNPTSGATEVAGVDFITYELEVDPTADITLEVQFCNDSKITSSSDFKPLNFSQALAIDGATDTDGLIHVENRGFKWLKLAVTNNGGTGSIDAWITGTVRGA